MISGLAEPVGSKEAGSYAGFQTSRSPGESRPPRSNQPCFSAWCARGTLSCLKAPFGQSSGWAKRFGFPKWQLRHSALKAPEFTIIADTLAYVSTASIPPYSASSRSRASWACRCASNRCTDRHLGCLSRRELQLSGPRGPGASASRPSNVCWVSSRWRRAEQTPRQISRGLGLESLSRCGRGEAV